MRKRTPGRRNILNVDRSWAPKPKPAPIRLYGVRPEAVLENGKEVLTRELLTWALDRHDATYGRPLSD